MSGAAEMCTVVLLLKVRDREGDQVKESGDGMDRVLGEPCHRDSPGPQHNHLDSCSHSALTLSSSLANALAPPTAHYSLH